MNQPLALNPIIEKAVRESREALERLQAAPSPEFFQFLVRSVETLQQGGRIFFLGNGSAGAMGDLAAATLSHRFADAARPVSFISLTPPASMLIGPAAEGTPARAYARQVESHCREKDLLVLLHSEDSYVDLLHAARAARATKTATVLWSGPHATPLAQEVDKVIVLPAALGTRRLEMFFWLANLIGDLVEAALGRARAPREELVAGWDETLAESRALGIRHPEPRPEISIVIPTMNRRDYLIRTLDLILQNTVVPCEIILVDDSTDGTDEFVCGKYGPTGRVIVVHNAARKGVVASANLGFAIACGKYVVGLNDDLYVLKGWDSGLIGLMEHEPLCGVATPLILEADGTIQSMGVIEGTPSLKYPDIPPVFGSLGWNARGRRPEECPEARWIRECDYACVCFFRHEVLHEVGGIDLRFKKYCADADWGMRIRLAGYKILYCPRSVVVHLQLSREEEKATQEHLQRDQKIFREKWGIYSPRYWND